MDGVLTRGAEEGFAWKKRCVTWPSLPSVASTAPDPAIVAKHELLSTESKPLLDEVVVPMTLLRTRFCSFLVGDLDLGVVDLRKGEEDLLFSPEVRRELVKAIGVVA